MDYKRSLSFMGLNRHIQPQLKRGLSLVASPKSSGSRSFVSPGPEDSQHTFRLEPEITS